MDPHDQPKCYLVFQSKQAFISTYNPALPNQQSINPFLSRPPAGLSYTFNHQQLQLLQQQQQQLQSQHNFQRRSRLLTIWDCVPVPFQYGMFLRQPQPHYAMIPCGAAKRIRLEEVAEQPSNGVSDNFPVSTGSSPVKEAKLKPTRPRSQSLGIEGKDNGQNKCFVHDEARKATRGKRKRREDKKMDMDMDTSMDVDTELRL